MDTISTAQFEQILAQLDRIEQMNFAQKTVLNANDVCRYVGISKSWLYKLSSQRLIPHYSPNGKTLFFEKVQVDNWLLHNPIKTVSQLKQETKGGSKK